MIAPTPVTLIHYYDTRLHRILCGLRGFEHRSTKHSRAVTCQACVGLLGKRASPSDAPAADTTPSVVAP